MLIKHIILLVLVIMNASAGIFLVELFYDQHHHQAEAAAAVADAAEIPNITESSSSRSIFRFLPTFTLLSGMIIAGFPEKNAGWCFWSSSLSVIGIKLFGVGSDLSRHWSSIGASMILLGLLYLPTAQAFLSHPLLVWMGKVSFSIFLIHSMLIRSVFCWMIYAKSVVPPKMVDVNDNLNANDNGYDYLNNLDTKGKFRPPATGIGLLVTSVIFFPLLYLFAHLWMNYVEARCTDLARWFEDRMVGEGQPDKGGVHLLPK